MKPSIITLTATAILAATALVGCTAPTTAEPSTPQACIDALDKAEELDGYMLDAIDASSRAMEAAVVWDDEGIEVETEFIESITPEVQELRGSYQAAATECRAGS